MPKYCSRLSLGLSAYSFETCCFCVIPLYQRAFSFARYSANFVPISSFWLIIHLTSSLRNSFSLVVWISAGMLQRASKQCCTLNMFLNDNLSIKHILSLLAEFSSTSTPSATISNGNSFSPSVSNATLSLICRL